MAMMLLALLWRGNAWKWPGDASIRRLLALMAFLLAFGASSRVLGLDLKNYEQKVEAAECAIESYEAVYD